jgi:putative ABC transport system permease protein
LGVERSQLVIQFLGESVIMTNMAFVFAILFSIQLLPAFNNFMNLELSLSIIESWDTILMLYLVSVLIGFITGSYPAFVISRFSTIDSLKNTANKKIGNVSFQKALVTFQIAISSFLILSSSIIYSQLSFLANKDLGIQEDQVLYIPGWYLGTQIDAFKAQLSSLSSVEFVSMSSQVPPYIGSSTGRQWDPNNEDSEFYATVLMTDSDFMDAMGFELIAGRYFDEEKFPSDIEKGMLINKTMLDRLGWGEPENAIGYLYPDSVKIIGVVDDFHYSSLKNEIKPLYIRNRTYPNVFNYVSLRFNPAQVEQLISDTHEIWNSFETGEPFNYYFVDDRFEQLFETETKLKNALFVFTLIALFIAGLGLYGLALFTVKKRFKEIGIRKVLGASAQNILLLLLKEYILYTCIGFLICIPLAYYTMSLWLEDFAYRIDIPTYIFILTFTLILLISITTVLIEAYKAVIANPTISLKEQ